MDTQSSNEVELGRYEIFQGDNKERSNQSGEDSNHGFPSTSKQMLYHYLTINEFES